MISKCFRVGESHPVLDEIYKLIASLQEFPILYRRQETLSLNEDLLAGGLIDQVDE